MIRNRLWNGFSPGWHCTSLLCSFSSLIIDRHLAILSMMGVLAVYSLIFLIILNLEFLTALLALVTLLGRVSQLI
jgi:hypothetical protein